MRRHVYLYALSLACLVATPAISKDDPRLLKVKDLAPGVIVEMRYATPNNFTGHILYPAAECLLCEPAAQRLARVQKKLEKEGLGLKIWDCYRPLSVQKKLWDIVPDPRYVADPKTGSKHNRGASVDLTLVDSQGRELAMPTAFDEFSEKAHRSYIDLPAEVIKNRRMLQEAMESEGFVGLPTEWWHFDDPEWKNYSLRDEPLGDSALMTDKRTPVDQLIVVRMKDWNSTSGTLERFNRTGKSWSTAGTRWQVSLGLSGMAWGLNQKPSGAGGPVKREGDNRAPAGMFKVGYSYGYDRQPPAKTNWPYTPVEEGWLCVDDPTSKAYNQVINGKTVPKDWKSAEVMRRKDHLYKWVINIEQNPAGQANCGSCIFLHVWRKALSPTEGCTAMEENHMVELLQWLDPNKNPSIVQLPDEEYEKLKKVWDLP